MGFILFIVALILTIPLFVVNVIIAPIVDVITLKWKSGIKNLDNWFRNLAVSIDQFGNGSCYRTLNAVMITKKGYKFGNIDQTVSLVLGINLIRGNLTTFGKIIVLILNFIEKDHCIKAIWHQYDNDCDAVLRINTDFYDGQRT